MGLLDTVKGSCTADRVGGGEIAVLCLAVKQAYG